MGGSPKVFERDYRADRDSGFQFQFVKWQCDRFFVLQCHFLAVEQDKQVNITVATRFVPCLRTI